MSLRILYEDVIADLKLHDGQTEPEFSSGLKALDRLTWGFHRRELTILGGRPGHCKTSLALYIALQLAGKNKNVIFFSLEMAKEELMRKILSLVGHVPYTAIRRNSLTPEQWRELEKIKNVIEILPLVITEWGKKWKDVEDQFKLADRERRIDVMIIDYLQLMNTRAELERSDLQQYIRKIRDFTKEKEIATIVVSQIHRQMSEKISKKPSLEDLKGSGAIEEVGDTVIANYWQYHINQRDDIKNKLDILVLKNRHGDVGTAKIYYDPNFFSFRDETEEDLL